MNTKLLFSLVCVLIIVLLINFYYSISQEHFVNGKNSLTFIKEHDEYYTEWFGVFNNKRKLIYKFIKKLYRKCDAGPHISILIKTINDIESTTFVGNVEEINIMKKILIFRLTEYIKKNEYKKYIPKNLIKLKAKLTQILLDEYTYIYKGFTHLPCEYYVNDSCPIGNTSFCKKRITLKEASTAATTGATTGTTTAAPQIEYNSVCIYKKVSEIQTDLETNLKQKYGDDLGNQISAHVVKIYKKILGKRTCKMLSKYGKVYCDNHADCIYKNKYCRNKTDPVPSPPKGECVIYNSIYINDLESDFNKKKTDCDKDGCDFFEYPIKKKSLFSSDNSEKFGLCLKKDTDEDIIKTLKKDTDYLNRKNNYCEKGTLGTDYATYHYNSGICHIDCDKMNGKECEEQVNNCFYDKYSKKCKDRCSKIKEATICNSDAKSHCYWEDGGYTGRCIDILSKNEDEVKNCKKNENETDCNDNTNNCYWDRYERKCKVQNNIDVIINDYLDTNLAKELLGL